MLFHTCSSCGYEFSEGDKAWDAALRSQSCPECLNPFVHGFPPSSSIHNHDSGSSIAFTATPFTALTLSRSWVRFWARMLDLYMFCIVVGCVLWISARHALGTWNEYALTMLLLFAWIIVEALLLSSLQTTPGKWLLKTQLASTSGEAIHFKQALSRSAKVWWRGLAAGVPIASLLTLLIAYGKLTRSGIASWDNEEGFTITHNTIGGIRVIALIAFSAAFLVVFIISGIRLPGIILIFRGRDAFYPF